MLLGDRSSELTQKRSYSASVVPSHTPPLSMQTSESDLTMRKRQKLCSRVSYSERLASAGTNSNVRKGKPRTGKSRPTRSSKQQHRLIVVQITAHNSVSVQHKPHLIQLPLSPLVNGFCCEQLSNSVKALERLSWGRITPSDSIYIS